MTELLTIVLNGICNSCGEDSARSKNGYISLGNGILFSLGNSLADTRRAYPEVQKIILFGAAHHDTIGLKRTATLPLLEPASDCAPKCPLSEHHTESAAQLRYVEHALTAGLTPTMRQRPFCRYDFADEWNNLGFGRIRCGDSIWGVLGGVTVDDAQELAGIYLNGGNETAEYAGSYMALMDMPDMSILWCARPVGPVDSVEWSVIERFLSDWRSEDGLPCQPCLQQAPAGYHAITTMRFDCDEDISSARDVFEWYAEERVPFSLAIKTSLPMTAAHLNMLRDVYAAGGTLLSHSHSHPFNWGASKNEALMEAVTSRQWFRDNLVGIPEPDYAVSPFHTNPPYAMQALEQAGFKGVVSGIIHNDPEYLLGRAGHLPFTEGRMVSISQQSMLHGDCYAQQGESIDVHVKAFEAQYAAMGIFGYLDHPFSDRYKYGWQDKAQRLDAHKKLIEALRSYQKVLFWNQKQCFEWIRNLVKIRLVTTENGVSALNLPENQLYQPVVRYRGQMLIL